MIHVLSLSHSLGLVGDLNVLRISGKLDIFLPGVPDIPRILTSMMKPDGVGMAPIKTAKLI